MVLVHTDHGVSFLFSVNGNLLDLFNQPATHHQRSSVLDLEFADDKALITLSYPLMQLALVVFNNVATSYSD